MRRASEVSPFALDPEGLGEADPVPSMAKALYTLAVLTGSWQVLPKAWFALRRLRPDMNLLMTIAVLGAAGIGEWFEAATVAFLFAFSLLLESWSVGRARRAVAALLDLSPKTARVRHGDGCEVELPAEEVEVGAALVISTPVSIVAALTAASRQGVLIKGGLFVELPAGSRPWRSTRPAR